ncbi:unnamed protein product [Dovyalis caffra]|uniref:Uncharacterized protein n=1 Tax=Dovyalis caffra TaxID=77055 RepID=A0AAV1RA32_9ROSI|nr:unnamed protein product [Dovyalis caffra]
MRPVDTLTISEIAEQPVGYDQRHSPLRTTLDELLVKLTQSETRTQSTSDKQCTISNITTSFVTCMQVTVSRWPTLPKEQITIRRLEATRDNSNKLGTYNQPLLIAEVPPENEEPQTKVKHSKSKEISRA